MVLPTVLNHPTTILSGFDSVSVCFIVQIRVDLFSKIVYRTACKILFLYLNIIRTHFNLFSEMKIWSRGQEWDLDVNRQGLFLIDCTGHCTVSRITQIKCHVDKKKLFIT